MQFDQEVLFLLFLFFQVKFFGGLGILFFANLLRSHLGPTLRLPLSLLPDLIKTIFQPFHRGFPEISCSLVSGRGHHQKIIECKARTPILRFDSDSFQKFGVVNPENRKLMSQFRPEKTV